YPHQLKKYLLHTSLLFNHPLHQPRPLLFQAPQPLILHIHQPTYPFLTSSNPLPPPVTIPSPLPPTNIQHLLRLSKPY
ncbi:adenylosuccinate synthetase, partial [Bacillus pumilus]|uniref:adenylosuccinate synthetase n=1 Tax=Bacillus pumilus TaxID=1408 RepID=UPI0016434134